MSGTTSNVSILIYGSEALSPQITIHKNIDSGRGLLARGNTDKFFVNLPHYLGSIKRLKVWHDCSGPDPSWFLDSIIVKDKEQDQTTLFKCNRWLALEREDGKIERSLLPSSKKDLKSLKSNFQSGLSKGYADDHLWLSVITKTPRNTFTRIQRATCCLTLLFSAMLANAMFYRLDEKADNTIRVGPLKFSVRQVVVGIQSCLIVAPLNFLIVWLFRNTPPVIAKKEGKNKIEKVIDQCAVTSRRNCLFKTTRKVQNCNQDIDSPLAKMSEGDWVKKEGEVNQQSHESFMESAQFKAPPTNYLLPHWCRWIAWSLCFVIVVISSSFTFFYSLMWGKEIANQWLSSMFVSFIQDLFCNQPLKMFVVTVSIAYVYEKYFKKDSKPGMQFFQIQKSLNKNKTFLKVHSLLCTSFPFFIIFKSQILKL